jgi:hypothetical protein
MARKALLSIIPEVRANPQRAVSMLLDVAESQDFLEASLESNAGGAGNPLTRGVAGAFLGNRVNLRRMKEMRMKARDKGLLSGKRDPLADLKVMRENSQALNVSAREDPRLRSHPTKSGPRDRGAPVESVSKKSRSVSDPLLDCPPQHISPRIAKNRDTVMGQSGPSVPDIPFF